MLKSILLLSLLPSLSFAGELDKLQPNAWTDVKLKYEGAPNGVQIFLMGWNNEGTYDPQSKRVLVLDRWYDKVRSDTICANAVLAYDPASNGIQDARWGLQYDREPQRHIPDHKCLIAGHPMVRN